MRWRFFLLIFGSTFGFLGLVAHLYSLQIQQGGVYAARAASQYQSSGARALRRGTIYFTDKEGSLVSAVLNKEYKIAFAVPTEIQDVEEAAQNLSNILNLDIVDLRRRLSKAHDTYELLATKLDDATIARLLEAHIPGVYLKNQDFRFYPFHALASHLVGFVGPSGTDGDLRGRYGIEARYDAELSGRTQAGIGGASSFEQSEGSDIPLTIDRNIQFVAEDVLKKLVADHEATGGVVIVEEPKTGKILALGAYPDFDPNTYGSSPVSHFLDPAVEAVYEPGSVFKVLTMAAGIDAGKITPETTYTDTGSLTLNGKTIQDWDKKAHGLTTMTGVIENSLNLGAAFAEKTMGHEIFLSYLKKFGMEDKTDIGLPGEVVGSLQSLKKDVRDINFATASFGQGVSVTPLRLIETISAIANNGIMMKPYIRSDEMPEEVRAVITPETARTVTGMMVNAVKKNFIAQIPHYTVAGKTGTAQIPGHGGYTDEYIHTYVGFAPAYDPRFTVLIKLDKPRGSPLAGVTVVPAFREIAQFLLNYYSVPPDNLTPAVNGE